MFGRNKAVTLPIKAGDLTVDEDGLILEGSPYDLDRVIGLGWHWQSWLFNFIFKTHSCTLHVFLSGLTESVLIEQSSIFRKPKLVLAYQVLAQLTFEQRLKPYLDQLNTSGYFEFRGSRFYSNGLAESGGQHYSIRNAKFEPFLMTIRQGGIFSKRLRMDLTIDGDVFRELIDRVNCFSATG